MTNIWFTSDTHFGHANIIKYCNRPFANTEEMDEALIANHNARVKPNDHWYHLGDVIMGDRSRLASIMSRLNGKKRLIPGNHDNYTHDLYGFFEKVMHWRVFKDHRLVCTHMPLHPSGLRFGDYEALNVHGHIHDKMVYLGTGVPDMRYRCVSVEHTGYAPVHIDEVRTFISTVSPAPPEPRNSNH